MQNAQASGDIPSLSIPENPVKACFRLKTIIDHFASNLIPTIDDTYIRRSCINTISTLICAKKSINTCMTFDWLSKVNQYSLRMFPCLLEIKRGIHQNQRLACEPDARLINECKALTAELLRKINQAKEQTNFPLEYQYLLNITDSYLKKTPKIITKSLQLEETNTHIDTNANLIHPKITDCFIANMNNLFALTNRVGLFLKDPDQESKKINWKRQLKNARRFGFFSYIQKENEEKEEEGETKNDE